MFVYVYVYWYFICSILCFLLRLALVCNKFIKAPEEDGEEVRRWLFSNLFWPLLLVKGLVYCIYYILLFIEFTLIEILQILKMIFTRW